MSKLEIISILILVSSFAFSNCTIDKRPEYINKIPDVESFTYIPIPDDNFEKGKVDLVPSLFITGTEQRENFISTPFWIEKISNEIWIADPLKGEVIAFKKNGEFSRLIATEGRGPGELQQPAGIFYRNKHSEPSDSVWILDSGLKSIISFSLNGEEIDRIHNELILSEFFNNRIIANQDNSFIVPLMNHKRHVLGVIDQNGDLVDSFVNRIVPLGYQPVTHNRLYYDIEFDSKKIVYAYHGLPLIFLEGLDQVNKNLFDFRPNIELRDYNISLNPIPMEERVSVKSIVRDLFIGGNKIYFRLENEIIILNYETGFVEHTISLVDEEGFPMIFQQMIYSDGTFFLINRFTSDIFYFTEDDISNL